MKKFFFSAVCAAFIGVSGASNANANLLVNGDFNTGNSDGWSTTGTPGGTLSIVSGANIDGYAALLNTTYSSGVSSIYQSFYIPTGSTELTVSFDYLFTGTDNSLSADIFTATLSYKTNDYTGIFSALNWDINTILLDTSSTGTFTKKVSYSTTIDLTSLIDDNPNGNILFSLIETSGLWWDNTDTKVYLDNVDITAAPVPEPTTMLLFGTGLLGLSLVARRRVN